MKIEADDKSQFALILWLVAAIPAGLLTVLVVSVDTSTPKLTTDALSTVFLGIWIALGALPFAFVRKWKYAGTCLGFGVAMTAVGLFTTIGLETLLLIYAIGSGCLYVARVAYAKICELSAGSPTTDSQRS